MQLTPEMLARLRLFVCHERPQILLHEADVELVRARLLTLGDDFRLHITAAGRKLLEEQT